MRFLIRRWSVRLSFLLLTVILLAGCATGRGDFKIAEKALNAGNYDQAVSSLLTAVEKNSQSYEYRLKLKYARDKASHAHKKLGADFFAEENYQRALEEFQLAVDLDGSNFAASESLQLAADYLQARILTDESESLLKARRNLQAKAALDKALNLVNDFRPALQLKEKLEKTANTVIDGVELEVTSSQPITLNFSDAKLPDVFEIITSLSGINFILDEDVRGNNTTLFIEKATFAQALELLLRMNKLDKKILNSKTIILFPKTRDKQKQFEDQLIQTFYLSNIDAKKAVNLLRTMLQVRKIYVHEELNAIIIRDTADVIKLAARILEANDRSTSEVVFDLELIEVNHTDTRELGLKLSSYQVAAGLNLNGTDSLVSAGLESGQNIAGLVPWSTHAGDLKSFYTLPTAAFRLMKTQVDAEVLASPKIRVKNKEKAKVHVGSREPVITTTTTDGGSVSENVQYVDVGVKLDVEPIIQLDNTIVTKLGLEVSNVSGRETTANGTAVITISTTNADTSLTLKDGEQTIIGGLIRGDRSTTKNKIPFLGDIPFIGELFNGTDKTDNKREILLSITPHIVKSVSLPAYDVASIWSGGEDDLKNGRNFGSFADDYISGQKGLEPQFDSQKAVEEEVIDPVPVSGELTQPQQETDVAPETHDDEVAESQVVDEVSEVIASEAVAEVELPQAEQPANMLQPLIYIKGAELVKVDEPFSLIFYVDEVSELFSAPLYVQYDEELFEFISAGEGSFLKQGVSPTIFTHTALEGSGRIIVGLKQGAGGKGISGGGELFTMTFKATNAGVGIIEPTRTNFRNPRGVRLKADSIGLEIEAQ